MPSAADRTRAWARLGAQTRLAEIEQEKESIFAEFPDLRVKTAASKRRLSAAERKKLSDGMRRYWAKRKGPSKSDR